MRVMILFVKMFNSNWFCFRSYGVDPLNPSAGDQDSQTDDAYEYDPLTDFLDTLANFPAYPRVVLVLELWQW